MVPCCTVWSSYLPRFKLRGLYCRIVHVNTTVIIVNLYILSVCSFHCNISLSVYINKPLSVCCVLECLNICLQDVHLLIPLIIWVTFSGNVNMFLLSSYTPKICIHTHTDRHTHTHFIDPILVLQKVNMGPARKYRLLNKAWATRLVEALCYKPDGRSFDSLCYWIFSVA